MILKPVVRGLLTYVPAVDKYIAKSTRGTSSARYCYSVWLRHLVMAHERGVLATPAPVTVAELGPGDSLGIGLAALLSGAARYLAFDVVPYADPARNLAVLDELVALFQTRAPIPDATEFPAVKPYLPSYEFPRRVLTDEHLSRALASGRLAAVRSALEHVNETAGEVAIAYRVPWYQTSVIERDSVDMLYSQAVLEHVDDLATTYAAMASWLKPGGFASHEIAFTAHNLMTEWNGHRTISDPVWKLIRGRRPYLLNREPASTHIGHLKRSGLQIVNEVRVQRKSDVARNRLARRFRALSDDDLTTEAMFVQAVKPV
jgi:hypothetical protein